MKSFNRRFVLVMVFGFACNLLSGFEYFYPVANLNDVFFLFMYQKSLTDLEVWVGDISNDTGIKELSAFFFPSCVQLLPDKSGFSFIDRGKVRIKYFEKRAVHTLPIPDEIFRVTFMRWISENSFYMTAQESEFFKTYVCIFNNQELLTMCIQRHISAHFLYPTILNKTLFCIQKTADEKYLIVKKDDFNAANEKFEILHRIEKPICSMCVDEDKKRLFYAVLIDDVHNKEMLYFDFFSLQYENNVVKKLFNFCLPAALITGTCPERVFESLAPFLPKIFSNTVYFVHAEPLCRLFVFDLQTDAIQKLSLNESLQDSVHIFAPCCNDQGIICGLGCKNVELVDQGTGTFWLPKLENV